MHWGAETGFHVRDAETDALVRELARRRGVGLTKAVKLAVRNELRREDAAARLRERLRPLQECVAARPPTSLEGDKAFLDD